MQVVLALTVALAVVVLVLVAFLVSVSRQLDDARRTTGNARDQERLRAIADELKAAVEARAQALTKAEDARRMAEDASHLKDEFLATASHELRTPLNAIIGWVHVMKDASLSAGDRHHAIEAIERNAFIQTRLVEDLLDESMMAQGRVRLVIAPLDLVPIVDAAIDAVRVTADAKHIAIAFQHDGGDVPVMGDASRLQQAVWNLLSNSVKYTPAGGSVAVAAGRKGETAYLSVRDSGEGIDPDFLPFIFEPFRQGRTLTQRSGLGLGLAIVQRLVELHGGHITASSEGRGSGAEFVMTLPLASDRVLAAVPAVPLHLLHGLRVLLTEDDVDSAASVAAILAQRGCESRTAYTAGECLRILAEWLPDVMLCDVGLPDDDGYNLLKRIRELPQTKQVPAIALTAFSSDDDKARALAAGYRTHMSKPLQPELLLREISAAAGSRIGHA